MRPRRSWPPCKRCAGPMLHAESWREIAGAPWRPPWWWRAAPWPASNWSARSPAPGATALEEVHTLGGGDGIRSGHDGHRPRGLEAGKPLYLRLGLVNLSLPLVLRPAPESGMNRSSARNDTERHKTDHQKGASDGRRVARVGPGWHRRSATPTIPASRGNR